MIPNLHLAPGLVVGRLFTVVSPTKNEEGTWQCVGYYMDEHSNIKLVGFQNRGDSIYPESVSICVSIIQVVFR